MFNKLLCFSAAFVLCLTSFIIPSFATDYVYFPLVSQLNNPTQDEMISDGTLYATGRYSRYSASSTGITYMFSTGSNICFISENDFTLYLTFSSWSEPQSSSVTVTNSGTFSGYAYSSTSVGTGYTLEPSIPVFTDNESALEAFEYFLNNDPPSTDPIYDDLPNFNIQRGYAAYIDFGSDWSTRSISGTLTSSFPQYSSLISGDWDGTDNRRYFWTDSLPSNTNFTSNVGSAIDWTKVPPYDLLQRSKNGIWFIQSNSPLNRYLVIVNPNQWRYGQNPTDDTINSPITVSDLSGSTGIVQFFALNQKFDTDGTLVSAASDNASNNRTSTYDPDTGQWEMIDSNGNAADQVPGGESDTPVISSITDYIHNITSVLTNFANSVISLIQAPISHISELINAGSGFMSSLRGMYAWLPVDIQGLIIAALTVVIGIGVFKVFL